MQPTELHARSARVAPTYSGPANVSITRRKIDRSYEGLPATWFAGSPFLSCVWNAFAGSFPQGERYMTRVARNALGGIQDPELRKDVLAFIGQEATHALEHEAMNATLRASGYPIERFDAELEKVLTAITKRLSPKDEAAMIASLEHFTAMFAEIALGNPEFIESIDERVRPLVIWHAIEEIEHKAVAFDLYRDVDGSYVRLRVMYVVATAALVGWTLYASALFAKSHPEPIRARDVLRGLDWMYGFGNEAGYLRKMIPQFLDFFRPDHHPWDHDNSVLIREWLPVLESMLDADDRRLGDACVATMDQRS